MNKLARLDEIIANNQPAPLRPGMLGGLQVMSGMFEYTTFKIRMAENLKAHIELLNYLHDSGKELGKDISMWQHRAARARQFAMIMRRA